MNNEMTRTAMLLAAMLPAITGCGGRNEPVEPEPIAARQRAANWGVLDAGTAVSIRTVVPIDAREAGPAEGFAAVLAGEIRNAAGDPVVLSGSPARLVILPGSSPRLAIGAVLVEGNWRSLVPVQAAAGTPRAGVALGTLVDAIVESHPAAPPAKEKPEVTISGPGIHVPASTLVIAELAEAARLIGVP